MSVPQYKAVKPTPNKQLRIIIIKPEVRIFDYLLAN